MKKKMSVLTSILATVILTGCVATYTPPSVTFAAPPPVVAVEVAPPVVLVPETYVWDGFEFVGVVGADYVYLGPGGVWLRCEPWRIGRFHGWEHGHPDWRGHAIRNEHYRGHGPGRPGPYHR